MWVLDGDDPQESPGCGVDPAPWFQMVDSDILPGTAMKSIFVLMVTAQFALTAQEFTRGIGVYPGDPKEYVGPALTVDQTTYRNLALHRPAYHSSSYDYNLTAQLITDGIKDTTPPRWIAVSASEHGVLPKNEREWVVDDNWVTALDLKGSHAWVQFELGGGANPLEIDRVYVDGSVRARREPENWNCTVLGSDDGTNWEQLGQSNGMARPTGQLMTSVRLMAPSQKRFYRLVFDDPRATGWQVGEVHFFRNDQRVHVGGPYHFTSAWMPAGKAEEWAYVDLGAACTFDRVALSWIRRPAEGSLQVSDDATNWKPIAALPSAGDEIKLAQPASGRYVRVLMTRPAAADGYALSEMEVYGRGGPVVQPKPAPAVRADGRLDLAGGSWRLQRDSLVQTSGETLSQPGFRDDDLGSRNRAGDRDRQLP